MKLFSLLLTLTTFTALLPLTGNALNSENYTVQTVVIDAGHGGKDPGAIGGAGTMEKTVALNVALKVGGYIEDNFDDVEVIYTRTTDEFIELHKRASIANEAEADLFISIHANAAANKSAYGTETWVLGLHKSEANLEVVKRENAVIELEDDYESNYEINPNSPEWHIRLATMQQSYLDQSINLAAKLQDDFLNRAKRKSRGVKQAGFLVLYKTVMPSILVELGFLSNETEEQYLASAQGQDYLASSIFRAFKSYKLEMDAKVHITDLPQVEETENETEEVVEVENPIETEEVAEVEEIEEVVEEEVAVVAEEVVEEVNSEEIAEIETEEVAPVDPSIEYRIQIFASTKSAAGNSIIYKDFDDVFEEKAENVYRYSVGTYTSENDAKKALPQIRSKGYKDAFVVALKDGHRVSMNTSITQVAD